MRFSCSALALVSLLATACSDEEERPSRTRAAEEPSPARVVGVDPELFDCASLAPLTDLAAVLGGEVRKVETHFDPPPGTPPPCAYRRTFGETEQPWSFDLDCRKDAYDTAARLIEQYRKTRSDAGVDPVAVDLGRMALDHHGQSLLFVDDDAPCYVRVHGPEAAGRLEVARVLARRLTPDTAPMRRIQAH